MGFSGTVYSGFIKYTGVYWFRPYCLLISFIIGLLVGVFLGVSLVRG